MIPNDDERAITPDHRGELKKSKLTDLYEAFMETVKERSRSIDFLSPENFQAREIPSRPPKKSKGKLRPDPIKSKTSDLGSFIDKHWDELVPNSGIPPGLKKQQRIHTETGSLYSDATDYDAGIIHEIKPHSSKPTAAGKRAIGFDQAENYANLMDRQHPLGLGRRWKVVVHYYNKSDVARLARDNGYITQTEFEALPEEWRRDRNAPKPGEPEIRVHSKPVRRMTAQRKMAARQKIVAARQKSAASQKTGPRKLGGFAPGRSDILSAVYEYSGASEIVGGWADDLSDLVGGTGGPTPVDQAVIKAMSAIEDEFRILKARDIRRALWHAYYEGEVLFANLIIFATAITRPATLGLGNRPVHMHIYSIVPQLMPYYLTNDSEAGVYPRDDGKDTGLTVENRSRLLKAGLYHPKYDYLVTPGQNLLFYSGETLQGTNYSTYERVDLAALRATLPPITGTWHEMQGPLQNLQYSLKYLEDRIFGPALKGRELQDKLEAEYVFNHQPSGVTIKGRRVSADETGKPSYVDKKHYEIADVTWDTVTRSLRFSVHEKKLFKLKYNLTQIDMGMMVGKITVFTGFDEETQRYEDQPEKRYVIFEKNFSASNLKALVKWAAR